MIGILEPSSPLSFEIPGTCLFETELTADIGDDSLKRHPRHPDIILRPQPSDSPDDPLNWNRWKKEAYFAALLYITALAGVVGPLFVPAFSSMAEEFGRPISDIAKLNGDLVLALGISSFLSVVLANVFGKRPIYLLSALIFLGGCIWAALSKSYSGLVGARWIQGLGMGAFACLSNATVTDLFFLNEAGSRVAIWQLAWVTSISITPVISGQIISTIGWRNAFWILAGCIGPAIFGVVFFIPGSSYRRQATLPASSSTSSLSDKKGPAATSVQPAVASTSTVWSRYGVFSGKVSDEPLLKLMTTPFVVMFTPSIFWSMLVYGWIFSVTIMTVFSAPPFSLTVDAVGNIAGVPPLIGCLLGSLLAGPFSDWSAKRMALKNGGIFEAEMRLPLMVPGAILCLIGFLVFGFEAQVGAVLPTCVGIAIVNVGLTFAAITVIMYSAAVFPARGGETFGIIMLYKSCFAYGATYYVNTWIAVQGPQDFFGLFAAITMGLALTTIYLFVYGKRMRAFAAGSKLLGWATR